MDILVVRELLGGIYFGQDGPVGGQENGLIRVWCMCCVLAAVLWSGGQKG